MTEYVLDDDYEFTLADVTQQDYKFASQISAWLQETISGLVDDNDNIIFSRVNTGFDETTLKTFGKKPVCDIYIDHTDYEGDFDHHTPRIVHSIVLFYMKGANNVAYAKACELHDYLLQEFVTNESFQILADVVRATYINNSRLMTQPINKKWGVMGAFELSHMLY